MTFVLRMPVARGRRSRRKALAVRLFDLGVMALVAFAVGLMVILTVRYEMKVEPKPPAAGAQLLQARSMARVRWASVKPRLIARLAQPHSLELGQVCGRGATDGSAAWSTAGAASAA